MGVLYNDRRGFVVVLRYIQYKYYPINKLWLAKRVTTHLFHYLCCLSNLQLTKRYQTVTPATHDAVVPILVRNVKRCFSCHSFTKIFSIIIAPSFVIINTGPFDHSYLKYKLYRKKNINRTISDDTVIYFFTLSTSARHHKSIFQ